MAVNARIKELRKTLGLTQTEFGEKIGLKQAVVGQMEKGSRNLTDRTAILICREFNVNENWLHTGEGEMFIKPETFSLDQFVKERGASKLELEFLKVYFELDKDIRHQLVEHFVTHFTNKNTVVAAEHDPEDVTTEYEEAAYRKSFGIAEKTDLSASNTTEGTGNKASNQ